MSSVKELYAQKQQSLGNLNALVIYKPICTLFSFFNKHILVLFYLCLYPSKKVKVCINKLVLKGQYLILQFHRDLQHKCRLQVHALNCQVLNFNKIFILFCKLCKKQRCRVFPLFNKGRTSRSFGYASCQLSFFFLLFY